MKITLALTFLFLASTSLFAQGRSFADLYEDKQAEIVGLLKEAVACSDIAILQSRYDEHVRGENLLPVVQMFAMDLRKIRVSQLLKGVPATPDYQNKLHYIYWIDTCDLVKERTNQDKKRTPLFYWPELWFDNLVYLAFIQRQCEPLPGRVRYRNTQEGIVFKEDAQKMPVGAFMAKYNLSPLFSNRVYRLQSRCAFSVDYKPPAPPKLPDALLAGNDWLKDDYAPSFARKGADAGLVYLSHQEVSEILHIAYVLEGKDGQNAYDVAAKGSPVLLPMKPGAYTTLIGQRLYKELKPAMTQVNNK